MVAMLCVAIMAGAAGGVLVILIADAIHRGRQRFGKKRD